MRPWIRSLWNILPFEMSKKYVSWYLFRLWYMQSEAFPYKKSFEHSTKPCKHQNIQFLTILISKKCHFRTNVENQFWPVLQYVEKYADFESAVHFAWNLLKWWVLDDFHFWQFLFLGFALLFCDVGVEHRHFLLLNAAPLAAMTF